TPGANGPVGACRTVAKYAGARTAGRAQPILASWKPSSGSWPELRSAGSAGPISASTRTAAPWCRLSSAGSAGSSAARRSRRSSWRPRRPRTPASWRSFSPASPPQPACWSATSCSAGACSLAGHHPRHERDQLVLDELARHLLEHVGTLRAGEAARSRRLAGVDPHRLVVVPRRDRERALVLVQRRLGARGHDAQRDPGLAGPALGPRGEFLLDDAVAVAA